MAKSYKNVNENAKKFTHAHTHNHMFNNTWNWFELKWAMYNIVSSRIN